MLNKIIKIFKTGSIFNNKITTFILTFLGSFVGQLIVRITKLNGSLDKWWLLIPPLSIPPLSLIPAYLIHKNKIKPGQGGDPYDMYMFIPAIMSIITNLTLEHGFQQTGLIASFIKFIINFSSVAFALYMRDNDICVKNIPAKRIYVRSTIQSKTKSKTPIKQEKFTQNFHKKSNYINYIMENFDTKTKSKASMTNISAKEVSKEKILFQATIIASLMSLLPFILSKIPMISNIVGTLGQISPLMGILTEIIIRMACIMTIYMLLNMYNGRNIKKSCTQKISRATLIKGIVFALVTNILIETNRESGLFN